MAGLHIVKQFLRDRGLPILRGSEGIIPVRPKIAEFVFHLQGDDGSPAGIRLFKVRAEGREYPGVGFLLTDLTL
jgi:hypothetical protein